MKSTKRALSTFAIGILFANIFQQSVQAQSCPSEVDNASIGRRYETYFWRVGPTGPVHLFAKLIRDLGGQEIDYGPMQQAYERWSNESASDSKACAQKDYSQMIHGCGETSMQNLTRAMECHRRSAGGDQKALKSNQSNPVTGGRPPSINSAGLDEVTPQVPGCPKYVSKLNIEWRRKPGANPQLNIWEARNVSDKFTFRVTYRIDGANTDLPTLNPGDTAEAWGLRGEPPFVVRNFYDMKLWEKSNSQEKSLQCSLAIRPQ